MAFASGAGGVAAISDSIVFDPSGRGLEGWGWVGVGWGQGLAGVKGQGLG